MTKNNIHPLHPKEIIKNPTQLKIFKLALGRATDRKAEEALSKYQKNLNAKLFGFIEREDFVGLIGYEIGKSQITIHHIAVATEFQKKGIGTQLINFVIELETPSRLKVETDDDAVSFYSRLGFSCVGFISKHGSKRYNCLKR